MLAVWRGVGQAASTQAYFSTTGTGLEWPTMIFNTSPRISNTLFTMAGIGASAQQVVNWHT